VEFGPAAFRIPHYAFRILTAAYLLLAAIAHGEEPRPFVADVMARPIGEAADAPLRWKAKNVGVAMDGEALPAVPIHGAQPVRTAAFSTSTTRSNWNITRIDPSVRPAQAISDPFQDPFGDRKSGQSAAGHTAQPAAGHTEPLLLQPTQAEASVEELPPPKAIGGPAPRVATQPSPLISRTQEPAPMPPAAAPPIPGDAAPAPGPALESAPSGAPCDKVYNERNCCDTLAGCKVFRDDLLSDTIRHISLDITPRFSPDLTPEEDLAERTDKLRLAESITWRNRTGQVVATGKMVDLANNVVIIADDTGREVARLLLQDLGEAELCYVTAYWRLPTECGLGGLRVAQRQWIPSAYLWTASALCHKPLYFEEVQLERYGHTAGPIRGPFISGAHFFLNIAALPYKMAINPPHECQYALGYYRPGSCAPWMIPPIPLSLRGAAAETGAVLGGVFLIP